nr:MAG TPA: hypothetical protein [Caudoviricetes sp.]
MFWLHGPEAGPCYENIESQKEEKKENGKV